MQLEKRPTGGFIVLEQGDHARLKVPESVSAIPIASEQLQEIVTDLQESIDMAELALNSYRRSRSIFMFEMHGEIIALHGLLGQIEHYQAMTGHASLTPQFDRELWGSLHDEPVSQQPTLTVFTNTDTGPDFTPSGPSIA